MWPLWPGFPSPLLWTGRVTDLSTDRPSANNTVHSLEESFILKCLSWEQEGLSLTSRAYVKMSGEVVCPCNLKTMARETGASLGTHLSKFSWICELQTHVTISHPPKKKRLFLLRNATQGWPLASTSTDIHDLPIHKRRLQNSVKPNSKPCINICSCLLTIQVQKNTHLDNEQIRKSGTISQKWEIEFSLLDHSRKRRTEEHTENRWQNASQGTKHLTFLTRTDVYTAF